MNKKLVLAIIVAVLLVGGLSLFISAPRDADESDSRSEAVPGKTQAKPAESRSSTEKSLAQEESPANAPPRRLVGVVGGGEAYTHAVIADATTKEQKMYRVGDAVLPDNAELVEIQSKYVVLNGPDYGRVVLRLQADADADVAEESGTALPEESETPELDRELEAAFGPDPYETCEQYTQGAEQDACMDKIDDEIDRRIDACDEIEDTDAYLVCLDAAQALQDHPAFE